MILWQSRKHVLTSLTTIWRPDSTLNIFEERQTTCSNARTLSRLENLKDFSKQKLHALHDTIMEEEHNFMMIKT